MPPSRAGRAISRLALITGAVFATMSLGTGQQPNSGLALRGATIYVAPDGVPIRDGVVVTRNGRIEAVGDRADVALPPGIPVIDLAGQVVVAGFWNSHVHFSGTPFADAAGAPAARLSDAAREMLTRFGFTTVFDTGSSLTNTLALRTRIESGQVDGPLIFTAGDILYPAGVKDARFQIRTPADAIAATHTLLGGGADGLKVYAQAFWDPKLTLSPEILAAVRAETRRRHVQMFAHPSNREGLYNAIDAGVDVLVHTTPQHWPLGS